MSYLVLARKWRPQQFQDVVGQQHVVQAIQNAIRLDRLPHALLLTGSRGVGKTTIARLIAKAVNCLQPSTDPIEPCNDCGMCHEITDGRAVDIIEIDGASNRSIDDIRELRDGVKYLPTQGQRKVYIIDEVHMLTREAFNALLKTLEEPPGHVLFLFATTEPHKIPITILSRCQRFDFKRIPLATIRGHIQNIANQENITLSSTAQTMIARAANGGMRDSMSLLDQVIAFGGQEPSNEVVAQAIGAVDRRLLFDIGAALFQKDVASCLQGIETLFVHAYDLRIFTQELAKFLRDLVVVSVCENPQEVSDLTAEELAEMAELSSLTSPEMVQQMFRLLTQSAEDIARSSHPRLLLEMALIRMARLEPVRPFEDILRQLSSLENRLHSSNPGAPPATGAAPSGGHNPSHSTGTPPSQGQGGPAFQPAFQAAPAPPAMTPAAPAPPIPSVLMQPTTPTAEPVAELPPPRKREVQPTAAPVMEASAPPPPAMTPTASTPPPEVRTISGSGGGLPFSFGQWEQLLEKLHEANPFLAGGLQDARCLSGGEGRLILEFTQELQRSLLASDEKLRQLEAFLRNQGFSLKIETSLSSQKQHEHAEGFSGTVRAHRQLQEEQRNQEIQDLALQHPLVQELMQRVPGATILRIVPADSKSSELH